MSVNFQILCILCTVLTLLLYSNIIRNNIYIMQLNINSLFVNEMKVQFDVAEIRFASDHSSACIHR